LSSFKKFSFKPFLVKIKDLDDCNILINNGFDPNEIIGVIKTTEVGDGIFGCYINGNENSLLMGGKTATKLYSPLF
jgi:hypothetical protein